MNINRKKGVKVVLSLMLIVIMSISFAACNSNNKNNQSDNQQIQEVSYPFTFKDTYDREITLDEEPQRVISVGPNITEIIYALDMDNKLVGRTDFCDYPEEVANIESIGNIDVPNIEKIVEINPDLVIASSIVTKESVLQMEELGIKVAVITAENNFDGAYSLIEKTGQLLNAAKKAAELIENMKNRVQQVVDTVKNKVKDEDRPVVYYVMGFGEWGDFTAGKDTFIGQIIEMAGGKNAADDIEGWQYSIEKLIEKNPDIMICSKFFDSKEGLMNSDGYKELDAVKNNRVFEIDNNMLDRLGVRNAEALLEIAKIIHPDLF